MNPRPWVRGLWIAAGIAVLLAFLFVVRDTLPPFLIAFAIAALLDPLLDRMQRWGCSRFVAVVATFAIFLGIFLGVSMILVPLAIKQATDLVIRVPDYYEQFSTWARASVTDHQWLLDRLRLPTTTNDWLDQYHQQIEGFLKTLVSRLVGLLGTSLSKAVWLAIIPIVTFYLMRDIDRIRLRAVTLLPALHRDRITGIASDVGAVFAGYLRGLCIVCVGYAIVNGLILSLGFRLPYALVISMLSGILYAVPYVGAVATIALGTLVALTADPSTGYVLGVAAALLVTNQVFDQVVTPRIVGGLVGLHPVVSLFALTAGGNLFGLAGMILAVPVAASIQVVLVHLFPALGKPLEPEASVTRTGKEKLRARWSKKKG
jgi:predicted PurR-regulated permease PerM